MDTKAGIDPILTRTGVERTGAMYLAGQDPRQPLLSPAVVADLTGFPPMLPQVGTNEILLDDSTRLAARATAAGVDVILDITADVPGFIPRRAAPGRRPSAHRHPRPDRTDHRLLPRRPGPARRTG